MGEIKRCSVNFPPEFLPHSLVLYASRPSTPSQVWESSIFFFFFVGYFKGSSIKGKAQTTALTTFPRCSARRRSRRRCVLRNAGDESQKQEPGGLGQESDGGMKVSALQIQRGHQERSGGGGCDGDDNNKDSDNAIGFNSSDRRNNRHIWPLTSLCVNPGLTPAASAACPGLSAPGNNKSLLDEIPFISRIAASLESREREREREREKRGGRERCPKRKIYAVCLF